MKIVTPKHMPIVADVGEGLPWFFIGGPIRGGGDWQAEFCRILQRLMGKDDFVAVVPCRWKDDHPLATYFVHAEPLSDRQIIWERTWLTWCSNLLTTRGCLVFYLRAQVEERPPEMGVYARDTLGEIGEWRGRMMYEQHIKLVVGADPEFDPDCISVMKCNFEDALRRPFPIYSSMEGTAKMAIALVTA